MSEGSMLLIVILFLVILAMILREKRREQLIFNAAGSSNNKRRGTKGKAVENTKKVTFKDVAGCDEAIEELKIIVNFLKNPKLFSRLGGRMPKGALLIGPPGTGKTLIARAVAGEAGAAFLQKSGSEFMEMFVGVGASRIRDFFDEAYKQRPSIIFIDEIDAIGRTRSEMIVGGHDEAGQTLNQLLTEMDGFENSEGIFVLAATNRPNVLDPALTRMGRFDKKIFIGRPDVKGRLEILKVHSEKIKLSPEANLEAIAKSTPGFVGADLENIINEAAIVAAIKHKDFVETEDLENAKDIILFGGGKRKIVITEKEKKKTAYHEAGHALVAGLIHLIEPEDSDPLYKISVIPTGQVLGATVQVPLEDKYTQSKEELLNKIRVALGGRAAEEIIFKSITTGAMNDLNQATEIANAIVTKFGMSQNIGIRTFKKVTQNEMTNYSEETAKIIDQEINDILNKAQERVKKIIEINKNALITMAEKLLEKEVLESEEIKEILNQTIPLEKRNPNLYKVSS